MESNSPLEELVHHIVISLVDFPEQVEVTEIEDGNKVTLEVNVASSDIGRVIGKGGRVVNSIRTVAEVLAAKQGKEISLEIV